MFLAGVLLTAVIVVPSAGSDGQAQLFVLLGGGVLPLAAGTFIAANPAALRSRRDGTDELFGALPRRGISRTAAQLLAVAAAAPVALILLGAMFVALGAPDGLIVGFDGTRHVPAPVSSHRGHCWSSSSAPPGSRSRAWRLPWWSRRSRSSACWRSRCR